ncbi:Adenylate kinase [Clostridium cavendishii DSM 21758]|uniref:Adenylate kinase n=1 Tax=Clostridium cavendishii DSM 21758 TaxID=1121302 RepID=A0A1M6RAX7_9CLOT|nr:hypothetical protein [Clostridium cavendishii]SHK29570.1 Adenylate kinase [Clostridium cavendishii DSM 21758]
MDKAFKVYIIGSVASGKTTLAKKISESSGIPYYELDNVIWKKHEDGDIKRTAEERDEIFNNIVNKDSWIIEDVCRSCFKDGLKKADLIIVLDIPAFYRKKNILLRWIKQNLGLEKSDYKPTIKMLRLMYKWCNEYDDKKDQFMKKIDPYMDKVKIMKTYPKYDII